VVCEEGIRRRELRNYKLFNKNSSSGKYMPSIILSTIQMFIPITALQDAYYYYNIHFMDEELRNRSTNLVNGRNWI